VPKCAIQAYENLVLSSFYNLINSFAWENHLVGSDATRPLLRNKGPKEHDGIRVQLQRNTIDPAWVMPYGLNHRLKMVH